ncbi:MAG: type I pullulanase [Fusobacteria bacterium]|nr:type I pullulanase [Fusobacteriota bacterium]
MKKKLLGVIMTTASTMLLASSLNAWQDSQNMITLFDSRSQDVLSVKSISITSDGKPVAISSISASSQELGGQVVSITTKTAIGVASNNQVILSSATTSGSAQIYPRNVLSHKKYYYSGKLGLEYGPNKSSFALWAPTAQSATLYVYDYYNADILNSSQKIVMKANKNGVWNTKVFGNLAGKYYLYGVTLYEGGKRVTNYVQDPYSLGSGPNSQKSYIFNMNVVNASVTGWDKDNFVSLQNNVDAIIYELHVRDYTIDPSSGVRSDYKGKFLGLTEPLTKSPQNLLTGLSNLKKLGVTHVELLPIYDYASGDESSMNSAYTWYNWGYDPALYSNVEGSYATTPVGIARQEELKELVVTMHQNNIGVIKDVVFNHTYATGNNDFSIFDKIVPYYFYRVQDNSVYSNGSGCGNDVATERPMVRKFIVDSCVSDTINYHIDGFRFDLMGLIDTQTMMSVKTAVKEINPSAIIIGEGWDMETLLPASERAIQANISGTGIAAFNDGMRDNLRGNVFDANAPGFIEGATPMNGLDRLAQIIKGQSTGRNDTSIPVFSPQETVNYVSCHDNATLYDKISSAAPQATEQEKISMDALAFGIVMTSQGIAYMGEGEEFARTKHGNDNSYNDNDPTVNPINWNLKAKNSELFDYYQFMISLRKSHPAFRMTSSEMVNSHLQIISTNNNQIIYQITGSANFDSWKNIIVILNGNGKGMRFSPMGNWEISVNGLTTYEKGRAITKSVIVPAYSMAVLYQ